MSLRPSARIHVKQTPITEQRGLANTLRGLEAKPLAYGRRDSHPGQRHGEGVDAGLTGLLVPIHAQQVRLHRTPTQTEIQHHAYQ